MFAHLRWADSRALAALRAAAAPPAQALELYAHILGAEHIWLARLRQEPAQVAVWPSLDLDACAALADANHSAFSELSTTLDEAGLAREIPYLNSAGSPFRSSLRDILLHVALHGCYHRGQVALLLRQAGAEPPADRLHRVRAGSAGRHPQAVSAPSGPLAYAFWHWKRAEVPASLYESRQRDFQAALAAEKPPGFLRGTTARLRGAAWAAAGGPAYEDWYLVEDMAALERLNDAAITASRRQPHDAVAALAAGGTAGLYGLRGGEPLPLPAFASWFAKPSGMSYPALSELLRPLLEQNVALWSRRMTLGPTPEFCLHSMRPLELSGVLEAHRFSLESVWQESR